MAIAPISDGESGASVRAKLNNAFASLSSRAALESKDIHAGVSAVRLDGYSVPGDSGEALYIRAAGEPSHPGKVRSVDRFVPSGEVDLANGGWWELKVDVARPEMFGALGNVDEDGSGSDDSEAIQAAIYYARANGGQVHLGAKRYGISRTIEVDGNIVFGGVTVDATILKKMADIIGIRHSGEGQPILKDFTVEGRGPRSTPGANLLESTPAGIFTRKCLIERLRGDRVGSPRYSGFADANSRCFCWGFILTSPKDNVNVVRAVGLEGRSVYGDVVFVGRAPNSGADSDTNGMIIQVHVAFRFSAFAINYDLGWRSDLQVNHAEAGRGDYNGSAPGGIVRFGPGARSNFARILYSAGNLGRGVVFEGSNNKVSMTEERQGDSTWVLTDPRNSFEAVHQQKNYRSIARSTGSDHDVSVGRFQTDFHSVVPSNHGASFVLLTKWRRLDRAVDRQQLHGTIFFSMNSNTDSQSGRRQFGHACISVRNQDDFSSAAFDGIGPADSNLRLVTLTHANEPWLALAHDSDPRLFQHAYFTGALTDPGAQLRKVTRDVIADVVEYSALGDHMGYFGRPGDQHSTTISTVPRHLGQLAIVNGQAYLAVGTASVGDWKQITSNAARK